MSLSNEDLPPTPKEHPPGDHDGLTQVYDSFSSSSGGICPTTQTTTHGVSSVSSNKTTASTGELTPGYVSIFPSTAGGAGGGVVAAGPTGGGPQDTIIPVDVKTGLFSFFCSFLFLSRDLFFFSLSR